MIINLVLFLTFLAWCCGNLFAHHSSPSPSYPPHHCPFTPVEPGYGVDFENDYLFLLPAADLRMDPALRPRPVSSFSSVTLYNSKIMCTTRLSDGIFTVHRVSVATSARPRKSECVFRFYEYLTTHRDFFFYLHVEQFVFVFVCFLFFVFFCGLGRSGKCEGG
jgi:hypothetical protein